MVKYDQMQIMTNISTCYQLYCEIWKLVPGPFMILIKWQFNGICSFLVDDFAILDCLSARLQRSENVQIHHKSTLFIPTGN